MTANITNNIQEELESQSRAEVMLKTCKDVEANTKLHTKRINATTIVACKNADRIPLYEKSIKTIKVVQSNENL